MAQITLPVLFSKSEAASVKVSPHGKFIAWLARTDGVLNLFFAALPLAESNPGSNAIPGARALTAAKKRDICFYFTFSFDDARIIYLRETDHGSELYHLYSLDVETAAEEPVPCGRDLLASHPHLTCSVGFVGGLQLWLPRSDPSHALLATGTGSLLWDLSSLDLSTGQLTSLAVNPATTRLGIARLVLGLLHHLLLVGFCRVLSLFTFGQLAPLLRSIERRVPAPCVPLQYFVDSKGVLIGTASAAFGLPQFSGFLPGIALRFTKRLRSGRWAAASPDVPFASLNMQLVGSGAASGKMRFEALEGDAVALHTCDTADTTSYVRYNASDAPPTILAHDPRADIDGFYQSPTTGELDAILITTARSEIVPLTAGGRRLKAELEDVRVRLGRADDDSLEVTLVSRTCADDLWVIRVGGDTKAATFYLHTPRGDGTSGTSGTSSTSSTCLLRELICARPALNMLPLAQTEAITVIARDGEVLPAYLTRPHASSGGGSSGSGSGGVSGADGGARGGAHSGRRLPLALFIHGGPNERDHAGFDPAIQLLVARGIAVLTLKCVRRHIECVSRCLLSFP